MFKKKFSRILSAVFFLYYIQIDFRHIFVPLFVIRKHAWNIICLWSHFHCTNIVASQGYGTSQQAPTPEMYRSTKVNICLRMARFETRCSFSLTNLLLIIFYNLGYHWLFIYFFQIIYAYGYSHLFKF